MSAPCKPYASWRLIYNLDGSFRGYEWALDEHGQLLPSRIYAQEGRDDHGNPLQQPSPSQESSNT